MLNFNRLDQERMSNSGASNRDVERAAARTAGERVGRASDRANRVLLGVLAAAVWSLSSVLAPAVVAQRLDDGVCEYGGSSPRSYDLTQSEHRWAAVAVNSSGSDNKDLQLRNAGQIQVTLATSSWPGGTEFIVGDFNHNYVGDYVAHVHGGAFNAPYKVQWDSGGEMTVGTRFRGTIGGPDGCGLIRIWDLHLLAGRDYRFTLTSPENLRALIRYARENQP